MKQVQRYDFSQIEATKTDEGFLVDSPIVARVGIQEYLRADGSKQRELRLPEEVFNVDSLRSMKGKTITVDHPASGEVTSKTAHKVTVGTILTEGRQDGDYVRPDIVIHSPHAIGERRQLSLGYKCDLEETPGEHPEYGRYDAIQRKIRINHLSVVPSARAGAVARLNIDSNEEVEVPTHQPTENVKMTTVKVKLDNGLEYDVPPEVQAALTQQRNDASAAATIAKNTIDTLTAARDTLQARVDGLPAEIEKAIAKGRADAAERATLETVATGFKVDCKDKTNRQVKEGVIAAVRGDSVDLKDKSDVYVDAAFDMAVDMRADSAMARQRQDAKSQPDGKTGAYVPASQRYGQRMDSLSQPEKEGA